jgi:hypothetical protein
MLLLGRQPPAWHHGRRSVAPCGAAAYCMVPCGIAWDCVVLHRGGCLWWTFVKFGPCLDRLPRNLGRVSPMRCTLWVQSGGAFRGCIQGVQAGGAVRGCRQGTLANNLNNSREQPFLFGSAACILQPVHGGAHTACCPILRHKVPTAVRWGQIQRCCGPARDV